MGFKVNEVNAKGYQDGVLTDVTFCYTKLQEPDFKYKSKVAKEYTVACIVCKSTARAFKKFMSKKGYSEIDTEDFEAKYKCEPPFPDQDDQYIIQFNQDSHVSIDLPKAKLKAGDPLPYNWDSRPKVFIPVEGGVEDVTMSTLVGNGSTGKVSFSIKSKDDVISPRLKAILVEKLIPWEVSEDGGKVSAFGDIIGGLDSGTEEQELEPIDLSEEGEEEEDKSIKKSTKKPSPVKKPEPEDDEDDEDDIPF